MQLGFVSAILPDLTLPDVLAVARDNHYTCVELMCWPIGKATRRYAGVTHLDVNHFNPAEIQTLLAAHGITLSALGYYPNPLTPDPEEASASIAHLKKVIQAAQTLNIPTVTTFIGRDWHLSVEANWPRFLAVWPDIIAFAEDHGVRIAIENCPMLFTADEWPGGKNLASTPALWQRMFSDIPSPNFGLNYDPSHLLLQRMDYLAPLHEFHSRIFHVHAKDIVLDQQRLNRVGSFAHPNDYHSPVLPGLGAIDWPAFFETLAATHYNGPVCVEVEDRRYEGDLSRRLEALTLSSQYLLPIFEQANSARTASSTP